MFWLAREIVRFVRIGLEVVQLELRTVDERLDRPPADSDATQLASRNLKQRGEIGD